MNCIIAALSVNFTVSLVKHELVEHEGAAAPKLTCVKLIRMAPIIIIPIIVIFKSLFIFHHYFL
jgi:hypothetical protein